LTDFPRLTFAHQGMAQGSLRVRGLNKRTLNVQRGILKSANVALFLLYYISLYTMYVEYIQPMWASVGLVLNIDSSRNALAIATISVCAVSLPTRFRSISDVFLYVILIFSVAPTFVMFVYGGLSIELAIASVALFVGVFLSKILRFGSVRIYEISEDIVINSLIFSSAITLLYLFFRIGISTFELSFGDVYSRREVVAGELNLAIDGYISQFCMQCSLFASAISLQYRRYLKFVFSMILAVFIFGLLGHKSQIVTPFLIIAVTFVMKRDHFLSYITLFITIFAAYIAFYYIYTDDPIDLVASTFRRLMFMPVFLNQAYIDYAHSNGFNYWGDSKLSLGLVEYRDSVSPANAIGQLITGNIATHANTGLIGAGYLNAGFVGVTVYIVIISGCTSFIDNIARIKNMIALAALICLPPLVDGMMSSDLPGLILSGGLGFAMLIIYILPPGQSRLG
jgi:hypothetical protein